MTRRIFRSEVGAAAGVRLLVELILAFLTHQVYLIG
jgi:hypothetical protein